MEGVFKFNPNHDELGRFAVSGTGASFGKTKASFQKAAAQLYKDQNVKDWEKADYFSQTGPLTYFGTSRAFEINRFLRSGAQPGQSPGLLQDWVDRMHAAFLNFGVNVPDGTEVYRAISGEGDSTAPNLYGVGTSFASALDAMKEGDQFTDKGFVSTAASNPRDFTHQFGNKVLQITTKGLHKVLLFSGETEVLFQPGRKFKYLGKSEGKGDDTGLTFYRVEMT
jgi:hypothetical protein